MRRLRVILGVLAASAIGLVVSSGASAQSSAVATCSGGPVVGSYQMLLVTGYCFVPSGGTLFVQRWLNVVDGGAFNGISPYTNVTILGRVNVGSGGAFGLGCSPEVLCYGPSSDLISGGLRGQPAEVNLHNVSVSGGITVSGGGSGVTCSVPSRLTPFPEYSDLEDNSITGNVTIANMQSCWLGLFRNFVKGTVKVNGNEMADPDANEVASNTIFGNLICNGNDPQAQFGDSGGGPNVVTGHKVGECARL